MAMDRKGSTKRKKNPENHLGKREWTVPGRSNPVTIPSPSLGYQDKENFTKINNMCKEKRPIAENGNDLGLLLPEKALYFCCMTSVICNCLKQLPSLCPAHSPESRMVLVSSRLLEIIKFMTLLPQDLSKDPWEAGVGDGRGCCNPSPRGRLVLSIRPEAWQGRQGVDVGLTYAQNWEPLLPIKALACAPCQALVCTWPKAPCVGTTGHQASLCTDVPVDLRQQNELAVSLGPLPLMHRVGGGGGPVCGALADFARERRCTSWQAPGYGL